MGKDEKKADAAPPPPKKHLEEAWKTVMGLLASLDAFLLVMPGVLEAEKVFKLHRRQIFFYANGAVVFIILVVTNTHANLLTHSFGFFYPAMQSLKAAESGKKEECQRWLSFWIILAFLTWIEYLDKALLTMLPYYFTFKLLFILWLVLPLFNGASRIYHNFLKHLLPAPPAPKEEDKAKAAAAAAAEVLKKSQWGYAPLGRRLG
ncbi:Receptor expression-enhancing protein 5 [Blyttiomyces sp. JEL0837]|nr:Receptor expression-enhancing protein 5 [Blyttiomyces sp. JEL0837]